MMLPLHPQPRPDEILSSWMVRLAFANGFPLHTFYSSLLGYKAPIWNRDTDRHPAVALLEVLSQHTGQSLAALQALTLSVYDGILFEQLPMIGNAPWILPVGVFHRTRRRAGMQFCPICLQLDAIHYYRRPWRLAFYAICASHHCLMQTHCPVCHASVAYHRHGIGRSKPLPEDPLRLCHCCQFDLGQSIPTYPDWLDNRSLSAFESTIGFFEQGTWSCGQLTPPCGVPFFQGLRALIHTLSGCHGHRLRQALGAQLGVTLRVASSGPRVEFEHLEAVERLTLMLTTFWLLEDWPERFVSVCLEAGFTRSRMAENVHDLPFWLASVADEYLDCRPYLPNEREVIAVGNYLYAHKEPVSAASLGSMLGLARDSAGLAWRIWQQRTCPLI